MRRGLLVCAATEAEASAFLGGMEIEPDSDGLQRVSDGAVAVTGVGIPQTLMILPLLLAELNPSLVLNIGIAGAYPGAGLAIGDVTMARSEIFGDMGFELPDEPGFRFVGDAPFGGFYRRMPMTITPQFICTPASHRFAEVDACTVNQCTGTARTGLKRERLFGVGIESMEGAAVAIACEAARIPVCEIRAISNIAAERNMQPENIQLALASLRAYLTACREMEAAP